VPLGVRDVEARFAARAGVPAEDGAEVGEREVVRDQPRSGERVDRIEGGRDDVDDRKERERDRDQADQVAPPVASHVGATPRPHGGGVQGGHGLGLLDLDRRHRIVSSDFVRQNPTAAMPATMKKMKIDTAAASPYRAPPPAWKASLYV